MNAPKLPGEAIAPDERHDATFPKLTAAQIARIHHLGRRREVGRGQILVYDGVVTESFYVIISGAFEAARIVASTTGSAEAIVTVHGPGEFTGETNMLSGRPSLVRDRMIEDGEVLEVPRENLRHIVQTDAELSEVLMRAFILRRLMLIANSAGDAVIVGSEHSADTLRLRRFLTSNGQPYNYLDVERDANVQTLLDRFGVGVTDVPIVICRGKTLLRNPSISLLAECLGFNAALDDCAVRDVVVIGAGPSGLAAAVYAASEGLDVLVLELSAPGGQAGTSSRIENYLGFPTGISGESLAARALSQAQKFGAQVLVADGAARLDCRRAPYTVELVGGSRIQTRAVVIASGARYRELPVSHTKRFEGAGVYYGATHVEANVCAGEDVIVVGGGNSAGQAAVFLSATASHVYLLVRGSGLVDTMSRYLIQRIENSGSISIHTATQITALLGESAINEVQWRNSQTGREETRPIRHVFVMAGADPNTAWLSGSVALDSKGFIKTGADLDQADLEARGWSAGRPPYMLETSSPRVFAVGDVRSGSVKRVASAVGEGSICVQMVHRAITE